MPAGPNAEKRPADVAGNAVKVMRIATGEDAEERSRRRREGPDGEGAREPTKPGRAPGRRRSRAPRPIDPITRS